MEAFKNQNNIIPNTINTNQFKNNGTNEFDNQGGDFITPGDGNSTIGLGFDNQGNQNTPPISFKPIQQIQQNLTNSTIPLGACQYCKTIHPPLRAGEKCPNAGMGSDAQKHNIDDSIINKKLVDLRNIIISQMSKKNIKDGQKFFNYAIIELTKSLENYQE